MATISDLKRWIERDISHHASPKNNIHVTADQGSGPIEQNEPVCEMAFRFHIYTDLHDYSILAKQNDGIGYLGCITKCRKTRAGEDWHRGSDLPDGPLSEET